MAHFPYVRAVGTWILGTAIDPSELENFNLYVYKSLNADDGGSWAPSLSQIVIGGLGLSVTGPFSASDAKSINVDTDLTVANGATMSIGTGAVVNVQREMFFDAGATIEESFALGNITGSSGSATLGQAPLTRVPATVGSIVYTLPTPARSWQVNRVTRTRVADATTITVQRLDGTIMGVIASGDHGWIDCVAVGSGVNTWVVSAWGGNVGSISTL